jgi:hypothetical protein
VVRTCKIRIRQEYDIHHPKSSFILALIFFCSYNLYTITYASVLKIIPPSSDSWKPFKAASSPAPSPSPLSASVSIGSPGGAGGDTTEAEAVDSVGSVGASLGILGGGRRRDPPAVVTVTLGLGTDTGMAGSVEREASCAPLKRTRFPAFPVLGAQVVDSPALIFVLEENEDVSKVKAAVPSAPSWSRRHEERAPLGRIER